MQGRELASASHCCVSHRSNVLPGKIPLGLGAGRCWMPQQEYRAYVMPARRRRDRLHLRVLNRSDSASADQRFSFEAGLVLFTEKRCKATRQACLASAQTSERLDCWLCTWKHALLWQRLVGMDLSTRRPSTVEHAAISVRETSKGSLEHVTENLGVEGAARRTKLLLSAGEGGTARGWAYSDPLCLPACPSALCVNVFRGYSC